jgi:hypothetical protein
MRSKGDGQSKDPYADHRRFVSELPQVAPIGSVAFMRHLGMKQERIYRRLRNSLIGMDVVRFQGGRGASRSLVPGEVDFEVALAQGFDVRLNRETALYPLLMDPIDQLITEFHVDSGHKLLVSGGSDGVTPFNTSARGVKRGDGAFTRPDITVIAEVQAPGFGAWTDVHAVEVKPYWALGRDGLFEAAAQAALQRCSFAWLVAYVPSATAPGLSREDQTQIKAVEKHLRGAEPRLLREAESIGIGVALATELGSEAALELLASPKRQAMDPIAVGQLFDSLRR